MFEYLLSLDKQLFLFLNSLGVSSWDGFWLYLSRTISWITVPLILFLLSSTFRLFGWKRALIYIIAVVITLICTELLSIFVKEAVGRLRPCHDIQLEGLFRNVRNYCGGKYGYFSAHAANSFALAGFFYKVFEKRFRLNRLLLFWASLVAYSRIYIGVHYPFDVVSGAVIGLIISFSLVMIAKKLISDLKLVS